MGKVGCVGCGGVVGRVGGRLGPASGMVMWCYVCVCCESGLSVLMAGPGNCILCLADTSQVHPVFNPVAPYRYLLPNLYLSVADIANPDLFACGSRTWISPTSPAFMRSIVSHPAGQHGCRVQKQ